MTFSSIFIVGVGRSGTSLLQSMFAANHEVSYLPETSFLRRLVAHGRLQLIYKNQGKRALVEVLEGDEYFCRTGLDAADIIAKALARGGFLDAAVYLEVLASYHDEYKTWVGDKDPRSVEYLSLLKTVCPDAHVIHIFRDPRDVLASKKRTAWSRDGHVWKHIFANRVQFKIGHALGPKLFGKRYHEVCYEELLASAEAVLSALCKDIGIVFDEHMLAFGDAARKLVSEKELSWKKETFGPLLTENKGKWKTDLPPREVKLTELCCREAMSRGGYIQDDRHNATGLCYWLWIQTGRVIIIFATWPYLLYQALRIRWVCRRIQ